MTTPRPTCIRAAIAAMSLACTIALHAESTTYAPDPPDRTGDEAPFTGPDPGRVGSMAGVGARPSKAELAAKAQPQSASSSGTRLAEADRQFLLMAARASMQQVQLGQLAARHGQSEQVKKLGQRIAADHTQSSNRLQAIATRRGVRLDRPRPEKMSKADMANFDRAWLARLAKEHQRHLALFARQAQSGSDAELRTFARTTRPVLQQHLQLVQSAQQALSGDGTKRTAKAAGSGRPGGR